MTNTAIASKLVHTPDFWGGLVCIFLLFILGCIGLCELFDYLEKRAERRM